MSETNGGPAFPAPDFIVPHDLAVANVHRLGTTRGMSLRDYFAAKALVYTASLYFGKHDTDCAASASDIAEWCYEIADAMLDERGQP